MESDILSDLRGRYRGDCGVRLRPVSPVTAKPWVQLENGTLRFSSSSLAAEALTILPAFRFDCLGAAFGEALDSVALERGGELIARDVSPALAVELEAQFVQRLFEGDGEGVDGRLLAATVGRADQADISSDQQSFGDHGEAGRAGLWPSRWGSPSVGLLAAGGRAVARRVALRAVGSPALSAGTLTASAGRSGSVDGHDPFRVTMHGLGRDAPAGETMTKTSGGEAETLATAAQRSCAGGLWEGKCGDGRDGGNGLRDGQHADCRDQRDIRESRR